MSLAKLRKGYVAVGALVLVVALSLISDVSAQNAEGGEEPPKVDLAIDSSSNLSDREKVAWLDSQVGVCKGIYQRVQNMLDSARKEKDSIKITCLDDKLTQIHVNLRGIEERKSALEASVAGADSASANQQFTILKIYVSRIHGLKAEAEACVGDTDVVIGESETIIEIDENISLENPSEFEDLQTSVQQPPHASGFF